MQDTLLIVDDELDMLQLLQRSLEPELKCRVETASSGAAALDKIARQRFDLVLADIKMPGMDGLALLELIKHQSPEMTVVMMTAYGHIDMAVKAMKCGAYDFITKPFEHDALVLRLEKALERSRLIKENLLLQQTCGSEAMFQEMVGKSRVMQGIYETIQMVAKTDLTVLITGESGTGKDLTARAVHTLSPRSKRPYVAVNCPTVPENILESELFGYKKGAFTHATQDRKGLFQEAHTGTIFLDEIGDISPTIQTKLLRVIQEKEIKPLGDTRSIQVDVRILASTNQDLTQKIQEGTFREDFFYRLNVLPIQLPALRQRPEDIPLIAHHLVQKHSRKLNKPVKRLSADLKEALQRHTWPGNVRELENLIVQGILFSVGEELDLNDLTLPSQTSTSLTMAGEFQDLPYKSAKAKTLEQFNRRYIDNLLKASSGNVTQAAKMCGLERQALQQIMRRYGISADPYRS